MPNLRLFSASRSRIAATSDEMGSAYRQPFPTGRGGAANLPTIASTSAAEIQPQASDGGVASGTGLGASDFAPGAPSSFVVAVDAASDVRALTTAAWSASPFAHAPAAPASRATVVIRRALIL